VPPQSSSGGETRIGRITQSGNQKIRTLRVPWANSMVYRTNVCNSGSALGSLLNVPDPVGDRSIGERDWGTSPGPLWRRFQPIGFGRREGPNGDDDAQGGLPPPEEGVSRV
jgi:hypothetical protein